MAKLYRVRCIKGEGQRDFIEKMVSRFLKGDIQNFEIVVSDAYSPDIAYKFYEHYKRCPI